MTSNQQEVIKWWHSGRDYTKGVMLYARLGKNKTLVHTFMKKHERFGRRKLEYELPKSVGLDWKKMPKPSGETHQKNQSGDKTNKPGRSQPVKPKNSTGKSPIETSGQNTEGKKGQESKRLPKTISGQDNVGTEKSKELQKQYPKVIRRLKYEYSDLFTRRSLLHKRMRAVPPENSGQNMNSRAMLFQQIRTITDRLEFLYSYIEDYENRGVIPISEEIWPAKKKKQLSDDPSELKKQKKNLQSANTKDRNQLLYQQKSRGKKEKPMPEGPKRRKIEFRIKKREIEIQSIDQKLVDLENAD